MIRPAHASPAGWRRAEPPQRPVLFVNPASGGGTAHRVGLVDRARELGIATRELRRGDDLAALAAEAVADGADALGVAGGDGSLSVVAAVAHAHEIPFVCIPAGTRNHFALDIGVDRHDPLGALQAFTDGVERTIDLGSVNGRLFLNNVSLGIYGEAVHQPEYRDAKVRTLLATARDVLGPGAAPAPELAVSDDEGREHRRPALVLVSNNPYALEPPAPGTRPVLDSGRLGVLIVDEPEPGCPPARAWDAVSLRVDAPANVHAGADGEAVDLEPPLGFRIVPKALRVRVAARHAAGASTAPPAV
ncbi:MAG TPA: diacylglycerol kinase family protein [Gaiellaceae bacterium]|nr:diacylglycerol kinase family protein [Gaiellaceae bacterium]